MTTIGLAPPSLAALADHVETRIDTLLGAEHDRWKTVDDALDEPYAALRAFITGGKRLRPAFCHWGFVGAGGSPAEPAVVDAGAALELLHIFALIHDDVMDGSLRRHGLPCVHVDFAERHRRRGWHGESRRFGDGAAILAGDLAFVYADMLVRELPAAARAVFDELRLEVNVGQYLDLVTTASRAVSVEAAHKICVYKSGKYTIERPLHLGAALAGRLDELAGPYTRYGLPLGEAFQLVDDLLGAFGDDDRLGKAVGEDLREGKPTALYALARQRARGAEATLLETRVGQPDLRPEEVTAIQEVLTATGARATVEATIGALVTESLAALAEAPISGEARAELTALAHFVAGRDY